MSYDLMPLRVEEQLRAKAGTGNCQKLAESLTLLREEFQLSLYNT